jgi:hypothetical protein
MFLFGQNMLKLEKGRLKGWHLGQYVGKFKYVSEYRSGLELPRFNATGGGLQMLEKTAFMF